MFWKKKKKARTGSKQPVSDLPAGSPAAPQVETQGPDAGEDDPFAELLARMREDDRSRSSAGAGPEVSDPPTQSPARTTAAMSIEEFDALFDVSDAAMDIRSSTPIGSDFSGKPAEPPSRTTAAMSQEEIEALMSGSDAAMDIRTSTRKDEAKSRRDESDPRLDLDDEWFLDIEDDVHDKTDVSAQEIENIFMEQPGDLEDRDC